jgi:hypothetical protein
MSNLKLAGLRELLEQLVALQQADESVAGP